MGYEKGEPSPCCGPASLGWCCCDRLRCECCGRHYDPEGS